MEGRCGGAVEKQQRMHRVASIQSTSARKTRMRMRAKLVPLTARPLKLLLRKLIFAVYAVKKKAIILMSA
jgi:hypothetical protein